MRFRFSLVPVALMSVIGANTARAESFLSVDEAQQLMFPGATFQPMPFRLTTKQLAQLRSATKSVVYGPMVKVWKASTGGWFYVDQVLGRDDRITYAVALDASGRVRSVEILLCDGDYADVRNPAWLRLFRGKHFGPMQSGAEIRTLSGATLSSSHIADGVTRILATHALFVVHLGR